MYDEEINKMVEELFDASTMEGSETGETWSALAQFANALHSDFVSEEFVEALKKEIRRQHDDLKANFRIVEEERREEVVRKSRTLECIA